MTSTAAMSLEHPPTSPIDDTLDIFSTSLFSLFAELPATLASPKDSVTYAGVTVSPPDTNIDNWGLQAHGVWRSAIYLAEHTDLLGDLRDKNILELGAASGLPGISIAKNHSPRSVTLSDYPDPGILRALSANVTRNDIHSSVQVRVLGHAWGADSQELGTFDVIVAADTLWMSDQHEALCRTLTKHLVPRASSLIFMVAGLHTGRHVIARFLETAYVAGLELWNIWEVGIMSGDRREWMLERVDETNSDRSLWVIEIFLRWRTDRCAPE